MEKFNAYCNPRKSVTWERNVFNTRNQQASKTIDQYVTDLKTKVKSCEFGTLTDCLIKDRIVSGIIDDRTRSSLPREPDLSLQKPLTSSQHNYAQIGKEMLTIVFDCIRFHDYVHCTQNTIETDHKPKKNFSYLLHVHVHVCPKVIKPNVVQQDIKQQKWKL